MKFKSKFHNQDCVIIQIYPYTIFYIKVQTLDVRYMMYHLQISKDWTECKSDFCKSCWHVVFPLYNCMLMTAFRITQDILDGTKTLHFFALQIFESHRSKPSTMRLDVYRNEKELFYMFIMSINWKNDVFRFFRK